MVADKSVVVVETVKVAAEMSKMKLAMVLVVLSSAITTTLIFSSVYYEGLVDLELVQCSMFVYC